MSFDPEFYKLTLCLDKITSPETLRQRMDQVNGLWRKLILEGNIQLLTNAKTVFTPCFGLKYVPLDLDVSPFDNSNTKKQGLSRTYEEFDGYAPIFAYLGAEGYFNLELHNGSDPCQEKIWYYL